MKKICTALLCAAIGAMAFPAGATVVTSIRISNANSDWLQISEVIATEAGTGRDVALATEGATATASSTAFGTVVGTAIDGVGPAPYPDIFHGGSGPGEYFLVTLAQAFDLSSLTIDGRADSFGARDYYAYQL